MMPFETAAAGAAKYQQLADWFAARIRSGELQPGERLPSDRQLAKQFRLSPTTTTAAMNELLHRHLVVRRLGAGTFVTDDPLEQNRRLKIGFFSTVSKSSYTRQMLCALWSICEELRCDLVPLFRSPEEIELTVADYRLDGVLIYNRSNIPLELIRKLRRNGTPTLLLSSILENAPEFTVGYSNEEIIRDAVRYLTGLGHRRIGFLIENASTLPNNLRLENFMTAMWEQQLPVNPAWMLTADATPERLGAYFTSPERPSAVIVGNQMLTPKVCRALEACAVSVPRDLSVFCIDEHDDARNLQPQFSRFRIDVQGFSAEGVRYLLALIHKETPQPGNARYYEFVDAGSCAPPPAAPSPVAQPGGEAL